MEGEVDESATCHWSCLHRSADWERCAVRVRRRDRHADPNFPNVPPHRHWINGVHVGPDICDNPGDPGIQHAFNEFHSNLQIATQYLIGPACTTVRWGDRPYALQRDNPA